MNKLPDNPVIKFRDDTLQFVRKIYNLDQPNAVNEAIDILEEWVKKQEHFTKKDFSREYLERIIITAKGSVERAKFRLDRVCTLRTLTPNLFEDYNFKTYFKEFHENVGKQVPLPRLTEDHYRLFVAKLWGDKFEIKTIMDMYRCNIIMTEYLRAHDYANGIIYVVDYRDLSIMDFLMKMNPLDLRQIITVLLEGYGIRIKGIHIVTASKFVGGVVTLFKQVLSAKIGERIKVHKDLESLYNDVPKELLPKDYGGSEEKTLNELHDDWVEVLSTEENVAYQKEMNGARTNEDLRQTDTFNDQYMGMPGTFRTLKVD